MSGKEDRMAEAWGVLASGQDNIEKTAIVGLALRGGRALRGAVRAGAGLVGRNRAGLGAVAKLTAAGVPLALRWAPKGATVGAKAGKVGAEVGINAAKLDPQGASQLAENVRGGINRPSPVNPVQAAQRAVQVAGARKVTGSKARPTTWTGLDPIHQRTPGITSPLPPVRSPGLNPANQQLNRSQIIEQYFRNRRTAV